MNTRYPLSRAALLAMFTLAGCGGALSDALDDALARSYVRGVRVGAQPIAEPASPAGSTAFTIEVDVETNDPDDIVEVGMAGRSDGAYLARKQVCPGDSDGCGALTVRLACTVSKPGFGVSDPNLRYIGCPGDGVSSSGPDIGTGDHTLVVSIYKYRHWYHHELYDDPGDPEWKPDDVRNVRITVR